MFLSDNGFHGDVSQRNNNSHHRTISSSSSTRNHRNHSHTQTFNDRLKLLYPNVNENKTPLPRSWSSHNKCPTIQLSQNNLRINYKGTGRIRNDAGSIRTENPIPIACGLYYFEVKIISKGKNGYMGIGLTSDNFEMNRLPGWDEQSYGYHGDDGNLFSSSGNGRTYGPTFTTDDIIGCGVNFIDNICFYTKNGVHLGTAFRDLPSKLYPTVGLQSPGEEIDVNFGLQSFQFDQIDDMMEQMRIKVIKEINNFPMLTDYTDSNILLHKLVSSHLVHNGYSLTADAFCKNTGINLNEDVSSIRNRQKISKLIMSGRMSYAIEQTNRSYPDLLENNKNLLFLLKCRQFIEMVNGTDSGYYCSASHKYKFSIGNQKNVNKFTKNNNNIECVENGYYANGDSCENGDNSFGKNVKIDFHQFSRKDCHEFERLLEFGKELTQLGQLMEKENKMTDENRQMLADAFCLIAYSNPWSSPMGWQLCPTKRESISSALNSAILESLNYQWRSSLEVCVAHASELLKIMEAASIGSCAFVNIKDVFQQK